MDKNKSMNKSTSINKNPSKIRTKSNMPQMCSDKYRIEVKLGNWFERGCKFVKNPHDFRTTNQVHYPPKPYSKNDPSIVGDGLFKGNGYGARVLFDHQAPHFLENKSTTYDLSFNHIPKGLVGPVPRELRFRMERYEPEQDYARNYGNVTRWGLLDYYKNRWMGENQDPRSTLTTHYQDTFLASSLEDIKFPRSGIPIPNSSKMVKNNSQMYNLKLRGEHVLYVPENELIQIPYKPRCNPITWECPTPYKEVPNKCVIPRTRKY